VFVVGPDGRLLLQRRAAGKYHTPGLWSNTCCSHPGPGEGLLAAARRRLKEEMGFGCPIVPLFSFAYRVALDHGLTEHELDWVLTGTWQGTPAPDPAEVSEWRWSTLPELELDLKRSPSAYTPWLHLALPGYVSAPAAAARSGSP
jgi:isopentenyl-diphosphate delta-isomerase